MKFSSSIWACITALFIFLSGCHIPSATVMYGNGGRTSYNVSAQNTTNQELLLNLVRLRYSDVPYFLELKGITTQFRFSGKLKSSIDIPDVDPLTLGGEWDWSNQPTIQYAPREGQTFISQLLYPLDLKTIQNLILSGWDVDRVFSMAVHHMNNLSNAYSISGLIPSTASPHSYKRFFEALQLLRYFQMQGTLQIGVRYMESEHYELNEKEDSKKMPNTLQISFPADEEKSHRLIELIPNAKKIKGRYILNIRQAFNEYAEMGIMTRSLLNAMYYLSLGVQVPPRDIDAGIVALTKNEDGTLFNWNEVVGNLIQIHWDFHCPQNAYLSIPYRGYWFYIDDSDVNSKHTFMLLQQIFNMQSTQQKKEHPPLTIPLGAGLDE